MQKLRVELWKHGHDHAAGVPDGIMSRLLREVRPDGLMCYLCCGSHPILGAINVDISPSSRADIIADATRTPFLTGTFAFVFADPPYPKYDSQKLYGCKIIPLYSLLEEMSRITASGGLYSILYPYRPHTLDGDKVDMAAVTTTLVHQRPRVLSVFRRGAFPGVRQIQYRKRNGEVR